MYLPVWYVFEIFDDSKHWLSGSILMPVSFHKTWSLALLLKKYYVSEYHSFVLHFHVRFPMVCRERGWIRILCVALGGNLSTL